jgi:hypothetical protein
MHRVSCRAERQTNVGHLGATTRRDASRLYSKRIKIKSVFKQIYRTQKAILCLVFNA